MKDSIRLKMMETAPGNKLLLLKFGNVICSGKKRYGNYGEPQPDVFDWRADCCGRFTTPDGWYFELDGDIEEKNIERPINEMVEKYETISKLASKVKFLLKLYSDNRSSERTKELTRNELNAVEDEILSLMESMTILNVEIFD